MVVKNSWGEDIGQGGFFYASKLLLEEFWVVRVFYLKSETKLTVVEVVEQLNHIKISI